MLPRPSLAVASVIRLPGNDLVVLGEQLWLPLLIVRAKYGLRVFAGASQADAQLALRRAHSAMSFVHRFVLDAFSRVSKENYERKVFIEMLCEEPSILLASVTMLEMRLLNLER